MCTDEDVLCAVSDIVACGVVGGGRNGILGTPAFSANMLPLPQGYTVLACPSNLA